MTRLSGGQRAAPRLGGTAARLSWFLGAVGIALAVAPVAGGGSPGEPRFRPWTATPGAAAGGQYHYSLTARVRPLMFWITRKGVGTGRIVRSADEAGNPFYELLIGSDPARAPLHINRWGYVAEVHRDGGAEILGVMTEADEQTVDAASKAVEAGAAGDHRFKAIRASVGEGEASAQVIRVSLAENLTLGDLGELLGRLPEGGQATARLSLPGNVHPGFLGAVAGLVAESADAARAGNRGGPGPRASYVWDRNLYDLTCTSRPAAARAASGDGGGACASCLETEFRIRNRATGNKSGFRLTYPTDGPHAGIPVRIVYRPRWWFEVELTLKEAR